MKLALIIKLLILDPIAWIIYTITGLFPKSSKIWIFISNQFADNPKYFYLYLNQFHRNEIRTIWITRSKIILKELRKKGLEAYHLYSLPAFYYALKGGVLIYGAVGEGGFIYRALFVFFKKSIKVNLWHGVPLKKIEYDDTKGKGIGKTLLRANILERLHLKWVQKLLEPDLILATSKKISELFQSAFKVENNKILLSNYPRVYGLLHELPGSEIGSCLQFYNQIKNQKYNEQKKIILYMPTFRDNTEERFFEIINFDKLDKFLAKVNAIFIIKLHYLSKLNRNVQVKSEIKQYKNIAIFDHAKDPYTILRLTDILVTDYSSIYFDFLHLNRPIVFFCFDLEEYLEKNRDTYFSYYEVTPGPKVRTFDELLKCLEKTCMGKDDFEEKRKEIRNIFFEHTPDSIEQLYRNIFYYTNIKRERIYDSGARTQN